MVTNNFAFRSHQISTISTTQNSFIKFHLLGKDFEVHQNRFTAAVIVRSIIDQGLSHTVTAYYNVLRALLIVRHSVQASLLLVAYIYKLIT